MSQICTVRYTKLLACVLLGLVVLAVWTTGCRRRERQAVVERRDIVAYVTLEGDVVAPPTADAKVLPPYEAAVDDIFITEGKAVSKGEVLMELSQPEGEAYYERARRDVLQARNQLQEAQRQYRAELTAAQRELGQARAAERQARQVAQGDGGTSVTVSPDEVRVAEDSSPELAQAIDRRRAAEQAVLDAQARMDTAVAPYQQRLVITEANFADAQGGRKAAMVRAPISGTVLEINARIGEVARRDENSPVARIVDLGALKVYAEVPEDRLDLLEPEQSAVVTVADLPREEFEGRLLQVYSEKAGFLQGVEHTGVIDFQNNEGQAKPGMDASARVKVGEVQDVLAVPASAVYKVNDHYAVRVPQDDEWVERTVEPGLSDGQYTEIRSGLNEGDIVLANP